MSDKLPTGVRRLDELLEGGVPRGSCTLAYGPPFIGKDTLTRRFLLAGMADGMPGILALTDHAALDAREHLKGMDEEYPKYEEQDLAWYVDCYAKSIGAEERHRLVEYVDGAVNLNMLSLAVNNVQRKVIAGHSDHRLVLDSISTLIAYTNAQTVFRFLQVLVGKARRAGATSMLLLEKGMHTEAEVQMFKHLADGVVEFKTDKGKNLLHIEGIGVHEDRSWVEYQATDTTFELTGSFAAGRIR